MRDSRLRDKRPSMRDTSVDVPPISKVISFSWPAILPILKAATAPPAGPEKIVRTGSSLAVSAEMLPPLDCNTRNRSPSASSAEREERYRLMRGAT